MGWPDLARRKSRWASSRLTAAFRSQQFEPPPGDSRQCRLVAGASQGSSDEPVRFTAREKKETLAIAEYVAKSKHAEQLRMLAMLANDKELQHKNAQRLYNYKIKRPGPRAGGPVLFPFYPCTLINRLYRLYKGLDSRVANLSSVRNFQGHCL